MEVLEGRGEIADIDRLIERLGEIGTDHGCVVAAFDARYLTGREHLARAAELADRAFERGENVADARSLEVLLYAAGRRQIDRALAVGVSAGERPVVIAVFREDDRSDGEDRNEGGDRERGKQTDDEPKESGKRDRERKREQEREAIAAVERTLAPEFEREEVLGTYDEELVREFFEISETELGATDAGLAALVGERVVLLDVER